MISASEKCLFKNVPISVSLSFSFFFCSFFHLCVNPRPPVRMREQRLTVFVIVSALMEGGWRTLLSTLCFVCPSFFCLSPSAFSSVCTSSVSLYVILTAMHNECFFFIVYFCESYLRQVNPQPAPLSLSVWIIRCLYENSQLRAQTGPATGFQSRSTRGATLVEYGLCSRCHHE